MILAKDKSHCCDCKVSWSGSQYHCCTCNKFYNKSTHCCTCKKEYNVHHCCKCKLNYDKYHCCDCNTTYRIFNIGCKCPEIKNNTTCSICMQDDIIPSKNFRTVCNKNLICFECAVASAIVPILQKSRYKCAHIVRIKYHILFE